MIIGINALGAISSDTGGRTYLLNFSRALQGLQTGHKFIFFMTPGQTALIEIDHPQFHVVEIPRSAGTLGRIFAENFILPVLLRRHRIDVMYFPGNFASYWCRVPYVVAIRSMLIFNTPGDNSVSRLKSIYRRILLRRSASRAARIITPSHHTREEIGQFLNTSERITVVPHGIDVAMFAKTSDRAVVEKTLSGYGIRRPFLLYVSALWEYKNHDKLILAFEQLIKNHQIPHRLVLVGRGMNSYESYAARIHTLVKNLGLSDRVTFIDFLPHDELRSIYQNAALFVFPSRTESFGHPLFEAMASGIPVVCSNTHGFEAMIPGCAIFADPYAPEDLEAAIYKGLTDSGLRAELIRNGSGKVQGMTWDHCAQQTLREIELAGEHSN